jgi:hypothetical protein
LMEEGLSFRAAAIESALEYFFYALPALWI